jgi:hypothetical protein
MKRFTKNILLALVAVVALCLGGCKPRTEAPKEKEEKFKIISIDKVAGSFTEGLNLTLTIANNTAYNLRFTEGFAMLKNSGSKCAGVTLNCEVALPRRATTQVVVPLKVTIAKSLAALSVLGKLNRGDYSGLTIDYSITSVVIGSKYKIEGKDEPLEEFAKQFNLGIK